MVVSAVSVTLVAPVVLNFPEAWAISVVLTLSEAFTTSDEFATSVRLNPSGLLTLSGMGLMAAAVAEATIKKSSPKPFISTFR